MPTGKKLLIVGQHFWPESFRVNDIADYFVEAGADVEVLCGLPNYPEGKLYPGYSLFNKRNEVHNKIKILRVLEIPRGSNTNFRIFLNYISFPFFSLFHIPRLLTRKYDRILIYQLSPVMMSIAGIIVGKLKRVETTMYVLDLWPANLYSVLDIKSPFLRKIARSVSNWHYRHVDKLMALSEEMQTALMEVTGIPRDRIIVLPQACEKVYEEKKVDKALREKFKSGFNILFAGNISPAQSFETIIAAAVKLQKDGIKDINWIIVGDGMSRKWLEDEVSKAKLDNFFFEGFKPISDIPKYTDVADALVGCLVKSDLLEATIPAKVLSYFAAGKPMVLAMDGEARELVNKVRCGYAGPTEDSAKLADNIKKIYKLSSKERELMGKRARGYHFRHFERNLILGKLYNFLFS